MTRQASVEARAIILVTQPAGLLRCDSAGWAAACGSRLAVRVFLLASGAAASACIRCMHADRQIEPLTSPGPLIGPGRPAEREYRRQAARAMVITAIQK